MPNLLQATWTDLNSAELRLLLRERFGGGPGQYDGGDKRLYLPLNREPSRISLTYTKITAVEPGMAFDDAEWQRVSQEIEQSVLRGVTRMGRDYSFSLLPVAGSWRGRYSKVQILSLQACNDSSPLQSSSIQKTDLKSDHFNGGGSMADPQPAVCHQFGWANCRAGRFSHIAPQDRFSEI